MYDTPGAVKASKSMNSSLLVTRAWSQLTETDHCVLVVDAAKRLSFEVTQACKRLSKLQIDAEERMLIKAI
jgi:GTPase Era involved in 16S rRNA processing